MIPWISQCAHTSILPGVTVGKAILALAYTTGIIYASVYKSNPFTGPIREGFVSASQIPVVIILATKNNIPGWLLGMSYERVRLYVSDPVDVQRIPYLPCLLCSLTSFIVMPVV